VFDTQGSTRSVGRRVDRAKRLVEFDLLARRLDLSERLLADLADLGERLPDLVRALERDTLDDSRASHQSVRRCFS
jgi:hypothetical protein